MARKKFSIGTFNVRGLTSNIKKNHQIEISRNYVLMFVVFKKQKLKKESISTLAIIT